MALKQSHVNQLHKIIASAEKLITEIEREIKAQEKGGGRGSSGSGARGGRKASEKKGRGGAQKSAGSKGAAKSARGGARNGGRKSANGEKNGRGSARRNGGNRRNRAQTAEFRQSILKELEGGTPVADLAIKHGITPAYIYQIKSRAEA